MTLVRSKDYGKDEPSATVQSRILSLGDLVVNVVRIHN